MSMFNHEFNAWIERTRATLDADAEPFTADPNKLWTVRKVTAYLPISDELLHPERYPAPKITWRQRVRWRWYDYRQRISTAWSVLRGRHDCGEW